jgi:hypothetical protein
VVRKPEKPADGIVIVVRGIAAQIADVPPEMAPVLKRAASVNGTMSAVQETVVPITNATDVCCEERCRLITSVSKLILFMCSETQSGLRFF